MSCLPIKKFITNRGIYRRFRKAAKSDLVRLDELVQLVLEAYTIMHKFVITVHELYTVLQGFLLIYGNTQVLELVASGAVLASIAM